MDKGGGDSANLLAIAKISTTRLPLQFTWKWGKHAEMGFA